MEVYKNISKIFYFIVGFAMGVLVAICSLNFAHASENKYLGIYDTLPDREGYQNIVVQDYVRGNYTLYSLDGVNVSVCDNFLIFEPISEFSKGGTYYWSSEYHEWTASSYSYPPLIMLSSDQYEIIHSDIDIMYSADDENAGEVYFYKTSKIISNEIYQPVQTVLFQNIQRNLKTLIPIGLIILGSMCGLYLIKKILDKFI